MKTVDLHVHSLHSDGVLSPTVLVRMAAERGLAAIAIADHDAVTGIDEALAAGLRLGIDVLPAVELSVEYGRYHDVHILGYCIDHRDPELVAMLAEFRAVRDSRGRAIVEKINRRLIHAHKEPIAFDAVLDLADGAVGRPHIGRVLVERGYARDMEDAFRRYLIPCDVPKLYIPAAEAIAQIRRVGGVAVLAHPTTVTDDRRKLRRILAELAALGLDGLEVFNNMCYKDDMLFLESLATENGLLVTGGSDFHGFEDDVEIGTGRGGLAVSHRLAEAVKNLAASRKHPLPENNP
ncbi:MAG: PHP domain-containing protein [Desulfuromonadales bacterium]|nr:MAG: PHP domain-containing protein [Desulfuromonadales bacterium]